MNSKEGERFGSEFVLHDELGRGAMGTVYSASKVDSGEQFAIKTLHPHFLSDNKIVGRFIQERDAFERVTHSNVVQVHDLVVDRGRLGIVMELLSGGDLKDVMEDRSLGIVESIEVALAIASGLEAIHGAKVVHRDLKPANVMVETEDGKIVPKIVDFGISRLLSDTANTVTAGIGTPLYMAPEATNSGPGASAPADVYALGAMLFEFLIGFTPFTGESAMALIRAHNDDAPPQVRGVPDALTNLIDQMLAKNPEDRPDAASVRHELERITPLLDTGSVPYPVEADRPSEVNDSATVVSPKLLAGVTEDGYESEPDQPPTDSWWSTARALAVGAAVLLVATGLATGMIWSTNRGDDRPNDQLQYAFTPRTVDGDLLVTQDWTLLADDMAISAVVSLTNVSGAPLDNDYFEIFAAEVARRLDDIEFDPLPDELLRQDSAVRYRVNLEPEAVQTIGYRFAIEDQLAATDFERLAESHRAAAAAFYAELAEIEVEEVALESLSLLPATAELDPGSSETLALEGQMSDGSPATDEILAAALWSSSDIDVAEVSNSGLLQAVAPGTATIFVQLGNFEAMAAVVVSVTDAEVAAPVVNEPEPTAETQPATDNSEPEALDDEEQGVEVPPPDPLIITGFQAINVTETSARIVWNSSECAASQIELNGNLITTANWPSAAAQCWEAHGRNYADLTPGTTYSVLVRVADKSGRITAAGPINFTTPDEEEVPPPDPLIITGFQAINVTETSARIVWNSSECAASQIELNGNLITTANWPSAAAQCWEAHGRNYADLTPGTTYSVLVRVADKSGRITAAGPINFTTPGG